MEWRNPHLKISPPAHSQHLVFHLQIRPIVIPSNLRYFNQYLCHLGTWLSASPNCQVGKEIQTSRKYIKGSDKLQSSVCWSRGKKQRGVFQGRQKFSTPGGRQGGGGGVGERLPGRRRLHRHLRPRTVRAFEFSWVTFSNLQMAG